MKKIKRKKNNKLLFKGSNEWRVNERLLPIGRRKKVRLCFDLAHFRTNAEDFYSHRGGGDISINRMLNIVETVFVMSG